ncbi:MAG: tetratricopeptide repeat protein [Pseudomonadota bacterium]
MKTALFFGIVLLALLLPLKTPTGAASTVSETTASLQAALESWDVETIWPQVLQALSTHPQDPELLETASHIAFYRGDYPEALDLMKKAMKEGKEAENRRAMAQFIEGTIQVLSSYKRYESPHFIIHLDERRDGILIDYLIDALEKTCLAMEKQYGFRPKEKVRVELFPDAASFYMASTLSIRDIEVTGAVGLTKFNKVQLLSPRALFHGYRWLDAVSHEYMHYLIVKLTANQAPIWFHEGLSKYEETRWREGPTYLSPLYRTLLADAQARDKLIGFEKMEPSLIHLETPEEVQLAYAQGASSIEFIIETAGHGGLKAVMDRMARSGTKGAGESIKEVLGLEFPEFEEKWRAFLAAKALQPVAGATVYRYKVKEGEVDADRMDLQEIQSLVARNRAHLGDRLKERGRMGAAVLEYRRALAETRDAVPVMKRLSTTLIDLGRDEEAVEILDRILALAPDHPTAYTQLGRVHLKQNDFNAAKTAFEESIQINPFNPEVHIGLGNAYAMLGDTEGSTRERAVAQKLLP